MENLKKAGQYMIGQDADGNATVILTDADGRIATVGGGGGGGGDVTIIGDSVGLAKANQLPSALLNNKLVMTGNDILSSTITTGNALKTATGLYAFDGTNFNRVGALGDSLKVNLTNNNIITATPVTPNNSATIPATKGLYIGGLGDVVVTIGSSDVTLTNLAIGVWHPITVSAVKATGTTATNILAGY
jgi:hypothetical protein